MTHYHEIGHFFSVSILPHPLRLYLHHHLSLCDSVPVAKEHSLESDLDGTRSERMDTYHSLLI